VKKCHGKRDGSPQVGYEVSRVGVVLTNLALVRLRKKSASSPFGGKKQ